MTDDATTWRATPAVRPAEPDPHGHAAILLVESLIHALVARSVISRGDAVNLISIAMDAKIEISADQGVINDKGDRSLALLSAILVSLESDEAPAKEKGSSRA